ncbi:hypothetical protein BC833DRAFT_602027 [Globomyces pollinis-pini]|nr:hypothetical protein BC833DRAFT_602027 [Globomyces pollinis-pini]
MTTDAIITAVDYVNELEEAEKEAQEALPGDPSKCFYELGYVRQRVYSCITCSEAKGSDVGVCYGCFVSCHTDHEFHELYFRRAFKCDCGTSKTINSSCQISSIERDPINELNHYNDNFKGVYCVCHKAYIENAEDQEMYQCYVCEDWYHEKCIDMPKSLDFENYLCENCIAHHPFLSSYISNSVITMNLQEFIGDCIYQQLKDTSVTKTVENVGNCLSEDTVSTKTNILKDKISNGTPNHMELLNQLKESNFKGALLLDSWQKSFCQCENCLQMYSNQKISFIIENEENIEPIPDTNPQTSIEAGLEKLQQIDRGKALDGIKHYNNLKDDLKTYLETFSSKHYIYIEFV